MKLSNKILIGFFCSLFIYLTAALAEVRFTGTPTAMDESNSIAEHRDTDNITYVLLDSIVNTIHVRLSDKPRLEVRSISGDMINKLNFSLKGDTLMLSGGAHDEGKPVKITLFVSEERFAGLSVRNSNVRMHGLQQKSLDVSQQDANIWMSGCAITNLRLDASHDSYFEIWDSALDTLSAEVEASELRLLTPLKVLNGSMKKGSHLRGMEVNDIRFTKDETSRLSIYR